MSNVYYAPEEYGDKHPDEPNVFLAGSIEMGEARDWQEDIIKEFGRLDVTILNPRRKEWDSSWEQNIEHKEYREQVEWELIGMDNADIIFFYFDPETKAPITLMELGLHVASTKKIIVCCPEGYWRKGNVDIICARHNVVTVDDLDKAKVMLEALILMWDEGVK